MLSSAHDLPTCGTVFNHPFSTKAFGGALFSGSHSTASVFLPFAISSLVDQIFSTGITVKQPGFPGVSVALRLSSGCLFSRVSLRLFHSRPAFSWRAVPTPAALSFPTLWRSFAILPGLSPPLLSRAVAIPTELPFPHLWRFAAIVPELLSPNPSRAVVTAVAPSSRRAPPRFALAWAASQTQACAVQVEDCSCPRLAGDRMVQIWAGA